MSQDDVSLFGFCVVVARSFDVSYCSLFFVRFRIHLVGALGCDISCALCNHNENIQCSDGQRD